MFPCQWDKALPVVLRILLPLRFQLNKAQMCLWYVILKRWASLWRRCGEFCEMIWAYILTNSNWRKNCSRLTTRSIVCSSIRRSNNLKMSQIFSNWMAWSINKMCVIGQTATHTYSMSHHWIPKKLRFDAISSPARYCEWEWLPFNANRIFLAPTGWYGLGGYVVPTGRRHKLRSECHN